MVRFGPNLPWSRLLGRTAAETDDADQPASDCAPDDSSRCADVGKVWEGNSTLSWGRCGGNPSDRAEEGGVRVAIAALGLALMMAAPATGRGDAVPRLALWIEPSANLPVLSTREGVAAILDKAKAAGVTVVIPEAKTAWGLVTYESEFAPLLRSSPIPRLSPPVYDAPATWYPQDYDLLQVMIEEAHRRGIRVHAAINVFGEGYTPTQTGLAIERPDWQAEHLVYSLGVVPSSRVGAVAVVNPALPEGH